MPNPLCAELLGSSPSSKKVLAAWHRLIEKGGSEFSILLDMGREDLERMEALSLSSETIAEAIMKTRAGEVSVQADYDGEYGKTIVVLFMRCHRYITILNLMICSMLLMLLIQLMTSIFQIKNISPMMF